MTRTLKISVAVLTSLLIAGCGSGRILENRPSPALTGPAIPAVPVQDPLPLDSFMADPCGVLERAEIAALIADPPDKVTADRYSAGGHACKWDQPKAGVLEVRNPKVGLGSLEDRMTRRREDPAQSSHWRELSIGGLPSVEQVGNPPVFEHEGSTLEACTVEVGATDTEVLEFKYSQFDGEKSQYWGDDRCAAALKAAEFVIGNLRGR